jgi:hypothetical protein
MTLKRRSLIHLLSLSYFKTAAIDTPGGKHNLKMKIKAQQMTRHNKNIKFIG